MKSSLYRLAQFLIYSSINVSVAAALFSSECFVLYKIKPNYCFTAFVFFSTMLTYSIHRYVGIARLNEGLVKGRFILIKKYRSVIGLTALASFIAMAALAFCLPWHFIVLLSSAGVICFLYVIPVMHRKKRLRDLPFIKIFLIALVWSFVAHIPLFDEAWISGQWNAAFFSVAAIEKLLYIFLITLPFDIRDLELDREMEVRTFPGTVGLSKSYRIIYSLLALDLVLLVLLVGMSHGGWVAYILAGLSSAFTLIALAASKGKISDIYYSGHLDGVIILRSLCILLAFGPAL